MKNHVKKIILICALVMPFFAFKSAAQQPAPVITVRETGAGC